MSGARITLFCPKCGSNRLGFPQTDEEQVTCGECGSPVQTLGSLKAIIGGDAASPPRQTKSALDKSVERRERHKSEIEASQEALRASVAETDRLLSESDKMLRRHRKEIEDDA